MGWALFALLPWWLMISPLGASETLKKASLMPLWVPQAQFAGYYVALDKGMYARHGIDLTLLRAGPGLSPADALRNSHADFAVLWLSVAMRHRSLGSELVNLAQIIQRSSMLLVSKKSSGIRGLSDMDGKKVGFWEGDVSLPARILFSRHGIQAREVRQSRTVNLFLRGGLDVASATWYNEYHMLLSSGLNPEELNVVFLGEQGMNFPEDGIYTLRHTLDRDPDLAANFVAASLEGWRYAFEHSDEALDIVLKYMRDAKLPANRMHQQWMLERMRDLMRPTDPNSSLGELDKAEYDKVAEALRQDGVLDKAPRYEDFVWRSDAKNN